MTDLERLFRRLVDNLIAIDPARLHRPLSVGELIEAVIPYRTNRRALALDTAEDYDALLLRLCAGEGELVRMVSNEHTQVFRDQVESPNPDLDLLRQLWDAELVLGTEALAHALGPGPEEAYAPPSPDEYADDPEPAAPPAAGRRPIPFLTDPAPPSTPMVPPPPRITAEPEPSPHRDSSGSRCGFCGGRLPSASGRLVNFCPHCGQSQTWTRCPECQSELELGWRHCINCGHQVTEG